MGEEKTSTRKHRVFHEDLHSIGKNRTNSEYWERQRNSAPLYQETTSFRSSRADVGESAESILLDAEASYRKARGDTGHPFDTYRQECKVYYPHWNGDYRVPETGDYFRHHGAPLLTDNINDGVSEDSFARLFGRLAPYPEQNEREFYGSKAIELTAPTQPSAKVALALGEILSGIPVLPLKVGKSFTEYNAKTNRAGGLKASGEDYLSVMFGIVPTYSDVMRTVEAVVKAQPIIEQYLKDSDELIRRSRGFPPESSVTKKTKTLYTPQAVWHGAYRSVSQTLGGNAHLGGWEGTVSTRITNRWWFSGQYQYSIGPDSDIWSKFKYHEQLANKWLGIRLTPGDLWELTPFSWLIDWYFNIGTVINNASLLSSDGLVLRYGYLMNTTVHETILEVPDYGFTSATRAPLRALYNSTRKSRIRANPYGFDRNPNSFTGSQWSILAALGLTMAPNKLFR